VTRKLSVSCAFFVRRFIWRKCNKSTWSTGIKKRREQQGEEMAKRSDGSANTCCNSSLKYKPCKNGRWRRPKPRHWRKSECGCWTRNPISCQRNLDIFRHNLGANFLTKSASIASGCGDIALKFTLDDDQLKTPVRPSCAGRI
jgi:hypothetical protein